MKVIMSDLKTIEAIREALAYDDNDFIFITSDGCNSIECIIKERTIKRLKYIRGRKVRCSEDDVVFNSLTDAAKAYNCTQPEITLAIKRRGTCHGYHFHYWYDEEYARKFDEWVLSKKEDE